MNSGFLDVFLNTGNDDSGLIRKGVDVDLGCTFKNLSIRIGFSGEASTAERMYSSSDGSS